MKMRPLASSLSLLTFVSTLLAAPAAPAADVALHFLDGAAPAAPTGISWGVPWPQGTVKKGQAFTLAAADGAPMPLQSWTLAYWPDGSIKWTGFATTSTPGMSGNLKLSTAAAPAATGQLTATDNPTYIQINTGPLQCVIDKSGDTIVDWMAVNGVAVAQKGQLVCILQNGADDNPEDTHPREKFLSTIKKVTLEQSGPVRATVKIEGMHKGVTSGREWLPFTVRLYFYSGETSVRLVHTIVFDGDQDKDFVRGLGIQFSVPMREAVQNRHVRFSGEDGGLWAEPIQPGAGNAQQAAGQPIGGGANYGLNGAYAIWDDYKLVQPTPDGFTITKRTNPLSTWIYSIAGKRSNGFAFVGDTSGGLGLSVKNFWQSFPASLEVQHASTAAAQLTAWLWTPDGPEMDMRHYDIKAHGLGPTYEDVRLDLGRSTAYGVARTSELTLFPTANVPAAADAAAMAQTGTELPMIATTPDYIHLTGVFGFWSVQDRSTPFKASIEDGLDSVLAFYEKQVDERHWYGFWQFGDFIHSYNSAEHEWYYDFGGHAWDNTELGVPIWLWYSYLRTGRADLFRLAEAHTRNTSETVVYHLGPMMGLGTRHNVVKWGDGAKEARVSQDDHWRFFYYLTTDERIGDIMTDELQADVAVAKFDTMYEAQPVTPSEAQLMQTEHIPGRIRVGPDWFALVSNWMTAWERTGDTKWRDRILVGVKDMAAMPYGIRTGTNLVMGWDPISAHLYPLNTNAPGQYNLATIQGGGELGNELSTLLDDPDWQRLWSQYCRLLTAPANVVTQDNTTHSEGDQAQYYGNGGGNPSSIPRLAAFAYYATKNPAFAQEAINTGLRGIGGGIRQVDVPLVLNPVDEMGSDTNSNSQNSLNIIEVLAMCADQLPTEAPAAGANAGGRRGAAPGGRRGAGAPATASGSGN